MSQILNEQENYILHTAITKINGLEKRTSELEEKQTLIAARPGPADIETDQGLVREVLAVQKENSTILTAISEQLKVVKSNVNLGAEPLKLLKSTIEISHSATASKLEEFKRIILSYPGNVLPEKRNRLFPELNAKEFEIVLKWIFFSIIAFLSFFLLKYLISCLFHLV